ncbi:hypothetical protein GCM10009001_11280 [Virgibacillus siamensis]|uniref:Protein translocase subunit SecE n=2 Tax=Virgibacillus siamensis TaxID=480071 RepID=A0ABN1FT37_9BACI
MQDVREAYLASRNKIALFRGEFGGTGMNLIKFFKNVSREMKKVSWPKGRELTSYTITVISTVAFVAIFFALIDLGITQILNLF